MSKIEDAIAKSADFNGVILIADMNTTLHHQAYGYANLEWNIPNTTSTRFKIGSLTKQFTAMAIVKLHEDGCLTLDGQIRDYLDYCPDDWQNITIHHLLTHTSGISNYTDAPDFLTIMSEDISTAQQLEKFIDKPLDFEPGSQWNYSNSGYYLLGDIIERTSCTSFDIYLENTFFKPLNIQDTGSVSKQSVIPQSASGYADFETRAPYINMDITFASGNLFSTSGDLLKWNHALHQEQVISKNMWDQIWQREVKTTVPTLPYHGYGLFRIPVSDQETIIGNDGGLPGFVCFNDHLLEANVDIIILSNMPSSFSTLHHDLRQLFT